MRDAVGPTVLQTIRYNQAAYSQRCRCRGCPASSMVSRLQMEERVCWTMKSIDALAWCRQSRKPLEPEWSDALRLRQVFHLQSWRGYSKWHYVETMH